MKRNIFLQNGHVFTTAKVAELIIRVPEDSRAMLKNSFKNFKTLNFFKTLP